LLLLAPRRVKAAVDDTCMGDRQAAWPDRFWRARMVSSAERNAVASSSVEFQPKLTRRAHSASSGATPMANRTWLTLTLPDEQAEPDETDTPCRSSAIMAVALLRPGMAKLTTLPTRSASAPKMTTSGA